MLLANAHYPSYARGPVWDRGKVCAWSPALGMGEGWISTVIGDLGRINKRAEGAVAPGA